MKLSLPSTAIRMAGAGALLLAPLSLGVGTAGAAETAQVTVVHGIPDTAVDVYVDGTKALPNFAFKTVTDELSLPAGAHDVQIRKAGDPATASPILSGNITLKSGDNDTLVAHLTADGQPALTPYVNPTTSVPAGMARVVVRHDAAAPAVDVLAGGKAIISALSNPDEKALMVPAGTVSVAVAAAGTTTPVIGPVALDLKAGTTTIVYAVGSLTANNLTALTQTYSSAAASTSPTAVSAGTGGEAADSGGAPILSWSLLAGGAVVFLGAAAMTYRRRAHSEA